jgi:pimeloyl-ACP methyl ester carboxylesterase
VKDLVSRPSREQFARVGELELCYERFGDPADPVILLVMGLGTQMVAWDEEFCGALVDQGFQVIRYDNRDIGRSTILRHLPVPPLPQLIRRDPRAAAYTLEDMADDAAGLLDALELEPVHVVGASMGGMIAQLLAIRHPARVRSLVSIMSTTGNRRVGRTHPRLLLRLVRRPQRNREAYLEEYAATLRAIGSRTHPPDPERVRRLAELTWERGYHPSGSARQLGAIVVAADRTPRLRELNLPATVIHGTEDQLVAPSGGRATARAIPGARLLILEGMGHDLPRPLWPQVVEAIAANAAG